MPTKTQTKRESTNRSERDAAMALQGFIPIDDAAASLKLSPTRTYWLAAKGKLTRKKVGGAVYVSTDSIWQYSENEEAPEGHVTVAEAIDLFKFSESTWFRRLKAGTISGKKVGTRIYLERAQLQKLYG